jgi:hypothetical protein
MIRRGLVVPVLALVFLFAPLIGSAARAKSQTFGTGAVGLALAWPQGGEGHRCAS